MSEKKETGYITFTKKQITSITKHRNNIIDNSTQKVMNMYTIKLPSKNYRTIRFGVDSQGIERDGRTATISIGEPYIYQNKDDADLFYTYPNLERNYVVNFKGHIIGKENNKNIFDKPESVSLTGRELINIFKEAKEISKQKKKELKEKAEQQKTKEIKETKKVEKEH